MQSGLGLIDNFLAEARALEKIAMAGLKLLTGREEEIIELADRRLQPVDCRRKAWRNGLTWRGESG